MDNLEKKINAEFQRVSTIINSQNSLVEPILDGFIDESSYNNSKYKCCFILKEPFDDFENDKPCGGGWSFRNILEKWNLNDSVNRSSTFSRVNAIVYSINHGFCDTENLTSSQLKQGFAACYWINLNKTPAYASTINNKELKDIVKLWAPMVHDQLVQANPDIIIFGNTGDWYYLDFPYKEKLETIKSYTANSSSANLSILKAGEDKLLVDAYHPGRKTLEYETQIISSLKDYMSL